MIANYKPVKRTQYELGYQQGFEDGKKAALQPFRLTEELEKRHEDLIAEFENICVIWGGYLYGPMNDEDLCRYEKARQEILVRLNTPFLFLPEWLPISEAPKDGTEIVLINKYNEMNVAHWYEYRTGKAWWNTINGEGWAEFCNPTHFMPLPPAPEEQE